MNEYKITMYFKDGSISTVSVKAANRTAAIQHFESLGYMDVKNIDCILMQ